MLKAIWELLFPHPQNKQNRPDDADRKLHDAIRDSKIPLTEEQKRHLRQILGNSNA